MFNQPLCAVKNTAQSGYIFLIMKNFIVIFLIFCYTTLNAQTIHTFYIDSTHITAIWPPPPAPPASDTSFVINNGDVIYFINQLHSTMFNVWINDPDLTGSPTYGTGPIPTNDTIFKIEVINDTTYFVNGWTNIYFLPDIVILNGTADWGRRYFINHNITNSLIEYDFTKNMLAYPIPANKFLNVNGVIEGKHDYYIFDFTGKLIKQGRIIERSIDVEYLVAGTYFLKVEGIEKICKFIKQ